MLINFWFTNWMSFKNENEFSMVAGPFETEHRKVSWINNYKAEILPFAVLYGGNASGKSNFVSALSFAQNLIVDGSKLNENIDSLPFMLDQKFVNKPCSFKFELLIDETLYEYGFSVTKDCVLKENLVKKIENSDDEVLFQRKREKYEFGNKYENTELSYIKKFTRENQLFLTSSMEHNLEQFQNIYSWFQNSVQIITPKTKFSKAEELLYNNGNLLKEMNQALFDLDTGIMGIENVELSENLTKSLIENSFISSDKTIENTTQPIMFGDQKIILRTKNGVTSANVLVTHHQDLNGNLVKFRLENESDGTCRLIDILPALFDLTSDSKTSLLVIDEIDSKLHSILSKNLLSAYLESCNKNTRTQLICTTHDLYLMSNLSLRRDEIWVADRDIYGVTRMNSFGKFVDINENENVFKLYLDGVLGGIPEILFEGSSIKPFKNRKKMD